MSELSWDAAIPRPEVLTDISATSTAGRGNNFGDICSAGTARAQQPTWVRLTQDVRSHTICFAPRRAREAEGGADLSKESVRADGSEGLQVMEELAWPGAAVHGTAQGCTNAGGCCCMPPRVGAIANICKAEQVPLANEKRNVALSFPWCTSLLLT